VTRDALAALIDEYEAGLDAELRLLGPLEAIALRQRDVTVARNLDAFQDESARRDRLTNSLLTIEDSLRSIRATLAEHRREAAMVPGYERVATKHREAQALVARILSADGDSFRSLAEAELARRVALASLEQGEMTLAAYRKVLAPPADGATLVDKRG
jgi:hypothetical protein